MAGSKDQNSEDELRVVEEEEVVRLESTGKKSLEKRGKVTMQPLEPPPTGEPGSPTAQPDDALELEDSEEGEELELEEEEEATVPMGWFYLLGIGLLGVIAWMGFQIFGGPEEDKINSSIEADSESLLNDLEARREAEAHFAAMEDVVRRFLAADTVEERLKYVRHPERIRPLMLDYYQDRELKTYQFEIVHSYSSASLSKRPFIALAVRTTEEESLPILVEDSKEGLLVDWESFVCYNPMTAEEFLEARPTKPVSLRVYAALDNFFAYDFAEEKEYFCFRLEFRHSDEHVFGYVKRGTTVEQKFRDLFKNGGLKVRKPLILSLSFPEGGKGDRSVLIEDVDSSLWAYGVNPEEDQKP